MVHQSANFYSDLYVETLRRSVYATPKNYLDFLYTFLQLNKGKTAESVKQAERLNVGIVRIDEASVLIQEMDKKLEKQRRELSEWWVLHLSCPHPLLPAIKTKKCDDLLEEITGLTAKQTERKSRVKMDLLVLRSHPSAALLVVSREETSRRRTNAHDRERKARSRVTTARNHAGLARSSTRSRHSESSGHHRDAQFRQSGRHTPPDWLLHADLSGSSIDQLEGRRDLLGSTLPCS